MLYRHYKNGKTYIVLRDDVLNTDNNLDHTTEESRRMVEYQALTESRVYVAPFTQFHGTVPGEHGPVKRFVLMET